MKTITGRTDGHLCNILMTEYVTADEIETKKNQGLQGRRSHDLSGTLGVQSSVIFPPSPPPLLPIPSSSPPPLRLFPFPSLDPSPSPTLPSLSCLTGSGGITTGKIFEITNARKYVLAHFEPQNQHFDAPDLVPVNLSHFK